MASYILAPEAEADLDEIWLFIANKSGSIDVADHFLDALTERLQLIANRPFSDVLTRLWNLRAGSLRAITSSSIGL